MSINFVRFLQELDIINEGVQSFVGERCYMATGDLSNEDTNELEVVSYQNKPSRAALTAKPGDVIFARMKGTNKVLLVTEKESNYIFSTGFVVIRSSENVNKSFLTHFLKSNLFQDEKDKLCTGATQKAINNQNIEKLKFPLPPLATQKRIAEILDAADALRRKDHELLKKYDELAQAIFIDMFGDPVKNEKGWDVKKLKDFGSISTGNTPSRADKTNFDSNYIEWIKTDNIGENKLFVTQSSEYLSEVGSKKGRITPKGSLLVACIAGSVESIGRAALTDRQVAFNQQINSIQPNSNVNAKFLYYLFKFSRKHIQNHASNGMKRMLSKGEFEKIKMILPELNVQNNFNKVIQQFEFQTDQLKDSNFKSMDLFNNLIQKAFKGELVS